KSQMEEGVCNERTPRHGDAWADVGYHQSGLSSSRKPPTQNSMEMDCVPDHPNSTPEWTQGDSSQTDAAVITPASIYDSTIVELRGEITQLRHEVEDAFQRACVFEQRAESA